MLQPRSPRDPEFLEQLADLDVDCAPVVAYGALVPQAALDIPGTAGSTCTSRCCRPGAGPRPCSTRSWPATRSPAPPRSASRPGWTPGRSSARSPRRSGRRDTAGDLLGRLSVSGAGLLVATLDGIADGSLVAEPQPAEGISLAPRIETADARIDWSLPAHVVDRRVRGVTPAPGAWTTWRGDRLRLGPVDAAARRRAGRRRGRRSGRTVSRRAPAGAPSAWATSSRRASGCCRPPTGRAARGRCPESGSAHDPAAAEDLQRPAAGPAAAPGHPPSGARRCPADRLRRPGRRLLARRVRQPAAARSCCASGSSTSGTPPSPPSWPTGRCAPRAPSTRSSPGWSPARWQSWTRGSSTCSGWAPTSSSTCGCPRTRPWTPPSTSPGPSSAPGRPVW